MRRGSGSLRKTRGHLGYRPPKDEAACSVKGTVYSRKQKSFALCIK